MNPVIYLPAVLSFLLVVESLAYWGFTYREPSGKYPATLRFLTAPLHILVLHHPFPPHTTTRVIRALIDWKRHPTLSRHTLKRASDVLLERAVIGWSVGVLHDDALRLVLQRLSSYRHVETRLTLIRRAASPGMLAEFYDTEAPLASPAAYERITDSIVASDHLSLETFSNSALITAGVALQMVHEHSSVTGVDLLQDRWLEEDPASVTAFWRGFLDELHPAFTTFDELLGFIESRVPASCTGWTHLAAQLHPSNPREAIAMFEEHSRQWRERAEYITPVVKLMNAGSPGTFAELCEVVDVLGLEA